MLSFKQFISESAIQRKFEKAHGAKPINHPDAPIVHHDPERQITVYHMKSHKALKDCTSGMHLCTHKKDWADGYMRHGNLFLIHHQHKQSQVFVNHGEMFPENAGNVATRVVSQLYPVLEKIPHHKVETNG